MPWRSATGWCGAAQRCWSTAARGSCDSRGAFLLISLALTSAFLARGKLPLPDPHQAEAEPGLVPAVCGGDAAGASGVDGSRGVALPCLPRDLLQQLLLHRQAAGDEDLQAGMARPSGLGRKAPQHLAPGQEGALCCCLLLYFIFYFFSSLLQTAWRNVLLQHLESWVVLFCSTAAVCRTSPAHVQCCEVSSACLIPGWWDRGWFCFPGRQSKDTHGLVKLGAELPAYWDPRRVCVCLHSLRLCFR